MNLLPFADHLWQSTLFAGVAGLLALALRKNRARLRHWLWFAASCKFLIPLSVLIALGSHIEWRKAPPTTQPSLAVVMDEVSRPFTAAPVSSPLLPPARSPLPSVLLGIWACGFIGISSSWSIRWRRIRTAVRTASPLNLELPIGAMSSPALLEPGIFGIFRPVLLLPEGIFERLTPPQLEAVIAHELRHVRNRDNLIAAIHMFVETVFWFHPLVWWIGNRMVEERERACDEEVLSQGSEPRVYAEAILNICKLYTESQLLCVSGVTGADLKKRIEAILSNRIALRLNFAKKVALASAGIAALGVPIVIGIMNAPSIQAQSAVAATPKFEVASIRPCGGEDSGGSEGSLKGGSASSPVSFSLDCQTVESLIELAYVFNANGHRHPPRPHQQIEGGPSWINSTRYRINAKAQTPQREAMLSGPMLQALLEDRFSLKIRRETREVPVYSLTVAKGGPKLHATKEGSCIPLDLDNLSSLAASGQSQVPCGFFRPSATNDGLDTSGQTIATLCDQFSASLDRDVIDKTGIAGRFDIHLELSMTDLFPRNEPAPTDPLASIQMALSKLGLKLESTKAPREFLVIDHVERPSEN